jgi:hypothetical protein
MEASQNVRIGIVLPMQGSMLWLKKNIFANKIGEKIGVLDSKQS